MTETFPGSLELGTRAGVGVRTLGDVERNRIGRPHRRTIEALVEALPVDETQQARIWAAARPAPAAAKTGDLSATSDMIGRRGR